MTSPWQTVVDAITVQRRDLDALRVIARTYCDQILIDEIDQASERLDAIRAHVSLLATAHLAGEETAQTVAKMHHDVVRPVRS